MNTESSSSNVTQTKYLNIVASESGLSEFEGATRVVFIPREKVDLIEIRHGSQAERPVAQFIVGTVLAVLGVVGVSMVVLGGTATLRWSAGFLFFGALGVWLLWEAVRRGHYLQVRCSNDTRKLRIRGKIRNTEFREFVQNAMQLGYQVRNCVDDKTVI